MVTKDNTPRGGRRFDFRRVSTHLLLPCRFPDYPGLTLPDFDLPSVPGTRTRFPRLATRGLRIAAASLRRRAGFRSHVQTTCTRQPISLSAPRAAASRALLRSSFSAQKQRFVVGIVARLHER